MSTFDPLAISIIGKAIDFLFDQASKTLEKSRSKKEAEREQPITRNQQKEEILQSLIGKINAQEVEHCMRQIERYTKNKQKIEIEIANQGGEIAAKLEIVNQLHDVEEELGKWITKLNTLIEDASTQG